MIYRINAWRLTHLIQMLLILSIPYLRNLWLANAKLRTRI